MGHLVNERKRDKALGKVNGPSNFKAKYTLFIKIEFNRAHSITLALIFTIAVRLNSN